jgi:hypothetical protein
VDTHLIDDILREALSAHQAALRGRGEIRKNAPESAVTLVPLKNGTRVCVKEFKWRGLVHSLKSLVRSTPGLRSFRNGRGLLEAGLGAARPLALFREKNNGLTNAEWVVMEAVEGAVELDRYLLSRINAPWTRGERRSLARALGRLIGTMHAAGVFHSDLKTCNILVTEIAGSDKTAAGPFDAGAPCTHRSGPSAAGECQPTARFRLIDYDDVDFGRHITSKRRVKNLVQLFLSTPSAIGPTDRLRFLREYALHAGMGRTARRRLAEQVLRRVQDRTILYVGFEGDVVEQWPNPGAQR